MRNKTCLFWFRRDLRLDDNSGFFHTLKENKKVQCIFIFDENILSKLPKDDKRIFFIYDRLEKLNSELNKFGSSLWVFKGNPKDLSSYVIHEYELSGISANRDACARFSPSR